MLNKDLRLNKNKHYQYIYNHGEHVNGKYVTVFFAKTHYKPAKVGLSVSGKIGNAVTRNRIRRRLRVVAQNLYPQLSQKFNYIFVCKTDKCKDCDFEILQANVLECLKKGKLTNEKGA